MPNTKVWDPKVYDYQHGFVAEYGRELLQYLNPQQGQSILDIGCGTGDLARSIADTGAKVIGIDSSVQMLEEAKVKYPELDFRCKNVLEMDFSNQFDSVFSNATLHWVLEPEKAVVKIFQSLKRGGNLVAEFGGYGNIANIQSVIQNVLYNLGYTENSKRKIWYFPTIGQYASILEGTGFNVSYAILYDRPVILSGEKGMEEWIRQFASSYFDDMYEEQIQSVLDVALEGSSKRGYNSVLRQTNFKDGVWFADYTRLRIVAHKD